MEPEKMRISELGKEIETKAGRGAGIGGGAGAGAGEVSGV